MRTTSVRRISGRRTTAAMRFWPASRPRSRPHAACGIPRIRETVPEAKGKYLGIAFSDGEIEVRVLQSVQEFIEEGKTMHHCVERYHDKSDSLILSARIADREGGNGGGFAVAVAGRAVTRGVQ